VLVKNWMTPNVVTIAPEDSMQHAIKIMKEKKIHMLPVVKGGKLVGVVSDSDLKKASASEASTLDMHELLYLISKIKVADIMTRNPFTVRIDTTVEETAELLMEKKISGVPVVDDQGQVAGIITRDDLFVVLNALSGFGKRGIQFAFRVEDKPGSTMALVDIVRKHGGRIASVLSTDARMLPGIKLAYIRVYDFDREKLPELQAELKEKAQIIYMVDHRENKREIYE
jgi:acetoin utilization protein AcuB